MSKISIAIFIIGTFTLILFTWFYAIKARRPHGIPRFFSFECILLLAILNIPVWLKEPFAWNQIISWILLIISLVFAVLGFLLLGIIGKPKDDMENTTKLVEVGLFGYIRHPLYSSLLFLGTGIFFKHISTITSILAIINIISLILTAKLEEKEMVNKFGSAYTEYMTKTKRFIPYIF